MTSVFLADFAQTLAERGIATTRFEFAYMAARHMDGVKRPPPRIEKLVAEYRQLFARLPRVDGRRLFIGGKSMGGRVASLLADELYADGHIAGAVCLGYPFHPARKPDQQRVAHLAGLACPTLIIHGTRDPLGSFDEVANYHLSPSITLAWLQDGDHDFTPRRASGFTAAQHMTTAAATVAAFVGAAEGRAPHTPPQPSSLER